MSAETLLHKTDPERGLSDSEVSKRKAQGLDNTVTAKSGKSKKQIVLEHCFTYFNLVFLVLAVVMFLSGSSVKNMTFLIIVLINTVIGIFQQLRAKRAVDKLTLVAAQQVNTLRNGKWKQIRSDLLVQDDIVEFHAGDQLCADGVVISGRMHANESLLTGEADAVEKTEGVAVLSGSFVVSGKARVQLTQVGNSSFAAKLAQEAKADPKATKSEMMNALDKLIRVVGIILIPVGLILFYQQFKVMQMSMLSSTESTVAALVGMIPEGLYLLTSVAMAVSALKLTKGRVLVQDMNCIESLARVDVLCVDKTGTITEPVMVVEHVEPLNGSNYEYIENILTAIYGSREPDNDTAKALQELFPGETKWHCIRQIPFDSQYKWSGSVYEEGSFLVGAPERVMTDAYETVQDVVEDWSGKGYRVLLAARYDGDLQPGAPNSELVVPLALVLLTNRIREKAFETFQYFREQGVTIKVISGDNPLTVSEVANRAGIPDTEYYVDAGTLDTDQEVYEAAERYTVFGRVTPDMKKRLVLAMKRRGHTVAMTGDGVNDVLAMKEADCGVAMASGAQAASQVARLVLMDSDFAAMPGIVGEGRRVINNIQRAAALFLVKNIFSLGMALICMMTQWAYPLQPFHLSIISALTIGVPAFFLAMEPNYERVKGRFLTTVLRQALPGGLANIITVLVAHLMMIVFELPMTDSATVCTAVLSLIGMMVLFKVSTPFDLFRKVIWCTMALALVGCFLLFAVPFDLLITDPRSFLVLLASLIMAPSVFIALQRIFEMGDKLVDKLRRKKK